MIFQEFCIYPKFGFVHEMEILDADQEYKYDKNTYSDGKSTNLWKKMV